MKKYTKTYRIKITDKKDLYINTRGVTNEVLYIAKQEMKGKVDSDVRKDILRTIQGGMRSINKSHSTHLPLALTLTGRTFILAGNETVGKPTPVYTVKVSCTIRKIKGAMKIRG